MKPFAAACRTGSVLLGITVCLAISVSARALVSTPMRADRSTGDALVEAVPIILLCLVLFCLYLWSVYEQLGVGRPETVPQRVRDALDALPEGVMILDRDQRIVLSNKAFANLVRQSAAQLEGRNVDEFDWTRPSSEVPASELPWGRAIREKTTTTGVTLGLRAGAENHHTVSINVAPVLARDGNCWGALATIDDLTTIERKNARLQSLLERVAKSRETIRRQNEELAALATLDPLTECLNRRAFFEEFETLWGAARRYGHPIGCLLIDVDHFKAVNDNHGHPVGDQVLREIADLFKAHSRASDLLCRYGGEEFCIVMPEVDGDQALQAAQRLRCLVESTTFPVPSLTVSVGVSTLELGAGDPRDMIRQADDALYAAKRAGRNRAVRCDQAPENPPAIRIGVPLAPLRDDDASAIPHHAVTSLIAALSHRDAATAEHSHRVADLCVGIARDLLSESDRYALEVAALMHDIGKLGVPDAILLKCGPLSAEEWTVMKNHEEMGLNIIRSAFDSPRLTRIVENHHAWYGGRQGDPQPFVGTDIPLGARILAICDAFDAMVSDHGYRHGKSRDEAFAELRRCATTQFDPELVERLIALVSSQATPCETGSPALSKGTALSIGSQIEKLAVALDSWDIVTLVSVGNQLKGMAIERRITAIADMATRLVHAATAEKRDSVAIAGLASDLLDQCRISQRRYLVTVDEEAQLDPVA